MAKARKEIKEIQKTQEIDASRHSGKWKKASMTVEASVLVPAILIIVLLLILLLFTVHSRSYYKAAACESVMKGCAWRVTGEDPITAAQLRIQERIREQPVPGIRPSGQVTGGRDEATAHFEGTLFREFGGRWFSLNVQESMQCADPVAVFRRGSW